MSYDPKIRRGSTAVPPKPSPAETPKTRATKLPKAAPQARPEEESSFDSGRRVLAEYSGAAGDLAEGRRVRGGIADDSVGVGDNAGGRRVRGGIADDSVGVGDDSAGRRARGGVADDSVGVGDDSAGRRVRGGVADDSVGVGDDSAGRRVRGGVADDSVGVGDDSAGRRARGGVADDSVGVGDDAAGRRARGGVADDSVGTNDPAGGRRRKGGVTDDSVGTGGSDTGRARRGGVTDDSVGVTVGPVTDANALAAREALYRKVERPAYLDAPETAPTTKPDVALLGRELPGVVSAARAATLASAAGHDPIAAARLQNLFVSTNSVSSNARSELFDAVATDGPRSDTARVIENLTQSSTWKRLSSDQKADLAGVISAATPEGVQYLGALIDQAPGMLTEKDSQGATLLANLSKVATQPLNASLYSESSSGKVLTSLLRDLANPNRIDQGDADTCTVTSMQWELVNDAPAEYARLMAGLAGPEGQATMQGGGTLKLGPGDLEDGAPHGRTVTSALFQSAAMDDADGRDLYDPASDRSTKYDGSGTYGGLSPDQQTHILEQLFGIKYSVKNLYNEQQGQQVLDSLKGFDASKQINRPVLIDIDQGPVNHTVTLEKVTGEKVFFRDPYGSMRSMPIAAFPKVVVGIHRPMAQA